MKKLKNGLNFHKQKTVLLYVSPTWRNLIFRKSGGPILCYKFDGAKSRGRVHKCYQDLAKIQQQYGLIVSPLLPYHPNTHPFTYPDHLHVGPPTRPPVHPPARPPTHSKNQRSDNLVFCNNNLPLIVSLWIPTKPHIQTPTNPPNHPPTQPLGEFSFLQQ